MDTVIFDKTGTLTCGQPEIAAVRVNPERPEVKKERALQVAAALEASSAHPIASAFHPAKTGLPDSRSLAMETVTVHEANGISGGLEGAHWKIGKAEFVLDSDAPGSDESIWLADEHGWVACFELQDALRPGAETCVRNLQQEGMTLAVLSGDSAEAVNRVADRLHISDRTARQSPEMKLTRLEELRKTGQHVLMVGDGVNDAPVLAAADVSMTVKGGAELANSAADMILTSESLGLVNKAISTARRTRQLVRQNLTWAVMYNASVMPLAVSGLLKPWMAALGMSLSSLLVVANASRLVRNNTEITNS
ncbi:heavy metal translocating P-type ATPase [Pseudomonadota bacterium]